MADSPETPLPVFVTMPNLFVLSQKAKAYSEITGTFITLHLANICGILRWNMMMAIMILNLVALSCRIVHPLMSLNSATLAFS